jgi:hypothetical protein
MVSSAHARRGASRAKRWMLIAAVAVVALVVWFRSGDVRDLLGKQYEYEEDLTIDLDGSGRLTINASLPALAALRGLDVDPRSTTVDRDRIPRDVRVARHPRAQRAASVAAARAAVRPDQHRSSTTSAG